MTDYQKMYADKLRTIPEALELVKSGDVIFTTNNYSEPAGFLSHLHEIAPRVENVRVWKGRSGEYPFMSDPAMKGHIEMYAYFYGPLFSKKSQPLDLVEFVPTDLMNYYYIAVAGHPANVYVTGVTEMDENGYFYLPMNHVADGVTMQHAIDEGGTIIVEVNKNFHRMNGSLRIHVSDVAAVIRYDQPELINPTMESTEVEKAIGETVASLVEDGDTIQLGIGGIPNAVGMFLKDKHDLGIHTEMFTTALMELIQCGAVNGERKTVDKGIHPCAFVEGEAELYDFVSRNKNIVLRAAPEIVDPFIVAQHDHMTAINTCVEIDLTGQVASESVGWRQIAGAGGAFCFAYGTFRAKHGKNILAFQSKTKRGDYKIKSQLTPGAIVTIPRNYVDYIVTEYGVARLKGCTVSERVRQLIAIAHPDQRQELTEQARAMLMI
ncbi:MAG: acetyl-CoA hydrolase [Oscillospiraceae bacterium]|nr:acetyl-CoA hydrolase [Oscillospiraceae bacterium]